jgi:hypothetical protein
MSKLKAILLLVVIISPVLIWLLWPSDESRIRKLIAQTAHAAEAGDVDGIMAVVDLTYHDSYGLSYLPLKNILEQEFKRLKDIDVSYSALKIDVFKDSAARASMKLEVLAGEEERRGYYLGGPGNDVMLTVTLGKNQFGQWRVTQAKFDPGGRIPFR